MNTHGPACIGDDDGAGAGDGDGNGDGDDVNDRSLYQVKARQCLSPQLTLATASGIRFFRDVSVHRDE